MLHTVKFLNHEADRGYVNLLLIGSCVIFRRRIFFEKYHHLNYCDRITQSYVYGCDDFTLIDESYIFQWIRQISRHEKWYDISHLFLPVARLKRNFGRPEATH